MEIHTHFERKCRELHPQSSMSPGRWPRLSSKDEIAKVKYQLIIGLFKLPTPLFGGLCQGRSKIFQGTIWASFMTGGWFAFHALGFSPRRPCPSTRFSPSLAPAIPSTPRYLTLPCPALPFPALPCPALFSALTPCSLALGYASRPASALPRREHVHPRAALPGTTAPLILT